MKKLPTISCCSPGAPPLPKREREEIAGKFKALADPTRLAIVNSLAGAEEVCVCELTRVGVAQPTVSHHLRVLRDAGLVDVRRRGTWAYYRLVPEAVAELAEVLGGTATAPVRIAAAAS